MVGGDGRGVLPVFLSLLFSSQPNKRFCIHPSPFPSPPFLPSPFPPNQTQAQFLTKPHAVTHQHHNPHRCRRPGQATLIVAVAQATLTVAVALIVAVTISICLTRADNVAIHFARSCCWPRWSSSKGGVIIPYGKQQKKKKKRGGGWSNNTKEKGDKNVRVAIDFAIDGNALLPIPVGDELVTVKQAIGLHVAWPKMLVVSTPTEGPLGKRKLPYKKALAKSLTDNPPVIDYLFNFAEKVFQKKGSIQITFEADIFGKEFPSYLLLHDIS